MGATTPIKEALEAAAIQVVRYADRYAGDIYIDECTKDAVLAFLKTLRDAHAANAEAAKDDIPTFVAKKVLSSYLSDIISVIEPTERREAR